MKLRLLDIKIKGKFEGRPSRKQVEVEDWDGPLISPSALGNYLACPRKWAFGALDNQYLPSTKSQALGTKLHSEMENWLTKGVPSLGRLSDSGALSLLPLPNSPGLACEQPFAVEISDGDRRGVLWGFRDVALPGMVMDLKTTSSLDWAKTPEELQKDPQANIYAAASFLESGLDYADLRWVYVTTVGAVRSKGVDVRLTKDHVTSKLGTWFDAISYMTELRIQKEKKALDLDPQRTACGDYGGCGYLSECGSVPAGGGFLSLMKQAKTKQERHLARFEGAEDVKILDKIKKDMGTWKTEEMAANAAQVPVRPAVKLEQAPATNPLKRVIEKAKEAEGINSPDARPVEDVPVEEPKVKKAGRPKKDVELVKKVAAPSSTKVVEGKWSSFASNLVLLVNVVTKRSEDLPGANAPSLYDHLLTNYPKCAACLETGTGSFEDAEAELEANPLTGIYFVEKNQQTNQVIRTLLLKADWVLEGV